MQGRSPCVCSLTDGIFITLEGGEGAGKSTVARRLAEALRVAGREVVLTREPGGTPGAEAVRRLLLDPATRLSPHADTLLHFAARADHVDGLIRPALARGAIVVSDRFYDSTMAYQAHGLGVDRALVTALTRQIDLIPNLTIILDVPEAMGKQRLAARGDALDRYELMGSEMMAHIAAGFRAIAAAEPARCVLIDAGADRDAVFDAVLGAVRQRLGLP